MLGSLEMISGYAGGKGNYYWAPSRIHNSQQTLAGFVQIQGSLLWYCWSSSAGGSLPFMKDA